MGLIGPLSPDVDATRAKVCFARIAGQKPEQLFRHPAKRDSLRCDDRKPFAQIEARVKAEVRDGPDARTIALLGAVIKD
jgi:hypothetical protein